MPEAKNFIFFFLKKGTNKTPIKKPPIWANHATPGILGSVRYAFIICVVNQINISMPAGILMTVIKNKTKIKVEILA